MSKQDKSFVYAEHLITRLGQPCQIFRAQSAMLSTLQVLPSDYKVTRTFRIYQLFCLEAEVYLQLSVSTQISSSPCANRIVPKPSDDSSFC